MRRFLTICLTIFALSVGAQAQTAAAPDYEAWNGLAERAEAAIASGEASTPVLELLRDDIAAFRAQLLAAESAGQARIDTLNSQIAALGPAPAEGETEAPELAARRAQLNQELTRLQAPRRAATEAFNRAVGLVGELDEIIRARETDALLELGPTPLNPAIWPAGLGLLSDVTATTVREVNRGWSSPTQRSVIRQNLPATLGLLVLGLMLIGNGRRWMQRATAATQAQSSAVGRVAFGFLVSLGQVVLPVLGIYALVQAARSTGLLGLYGQAIADALPYVGLCIFGALWLALRLFPIRDEAPAFLALVPARRGGARRAVAFLGLFLGLNVLLQTLFGLVPESPAAQAVLSFPLIVLIGLSVFQIGRILRVAAIEASAGPGETAVLARFVRLLSRALTVIGIGAAILAAIGYEKLAGGIVVPTSLSLALVGALAVIHGPISGIYGLITGRDYEEAREALVPVLISFFVTLASLPLFALIWGVRPAELSDNWKRFLEGVAIGETRLSPGDLITVLLVFGIGYFLTRMIQSALRSTILPRTGLDVGGRNAITAGVGYVGLFLAAVTAITTAGINLSSLAIVAGALSVGIGFGLQNIVSNFVSGIILLIERPISEGDWIEVGGQMGYVRDISVRSTRIETFDRTDVIVPNADLVSGTVTNWTRGNLMGRAIVPVGVAYGTDTKKVETILREIAEAHPIVAKTPPPNVFFRRFGADSLDFEIRAILTDVNFLMIVTSDLNHEIDRRFKEEGIEIPFAQRDLWLRNPEALRGPVEEGET